MRHIARKRFGQHFLTDGAVIDRIVRVIDPQPSDALVEIGPGLGALTRPLLDRAGRMTAIELDRDLAARWRGDARLQVIEGDALGIDFAQLAATAGRPLRVVGNLPYNISTPILFRLLEAAEAIEDQTLMLQKEVVDRMAASPPGRDYGRLSVMLQWRYEIEPLFDVAPDAFEPPPRVWSTVVRMRPLRPPPELDRALLGEVVGVAFSQRRKLLRHTLGAWLQRTGHAIDFNLQRRAEEVPVGEYIMLTEALVRLGVHPAGHSPGID